MLQLAVLKHRTGDDLRARAFLQRYMETNTASAGVLLLGCQIEEAQGDARAAARYSNLLFDDFPESAEARRVEAAGCSGTGSK
jgi:type IV pilus assembly protein PilF